MIAGRQNNGKDSPPTVSEIRQCLAEMMLGGFDTTSNTGALMFYSVAGERGKPATEFQNKLQSQVDQVIQAHSVDYKWVEYTAQGEWPLIGATIRETLRTQPVAEFISRGVDEAFDVTVAYDGGKEYIIIFLQDALFSP